LDLLRNQGLSSEYRECVRDFVESVVAQNPRNVEAIVLFGGLVREGQAVRHWSDIDIVVIFKHIVNRDPHDLAQTMERLKQRYSVRVDVTQVSAEELCDEALAKHCCNSELINALSGREGVAMVVFGRVPPLTFTPGQETQAALFYLGSTLGSFRRYLVETLYKDAVAAPKRCHLKRVTRWVFSIVRASLRLFDVYTHPYEYCLTHVRRLFPDLDISILEELIEMRRSIDEVEPSLAAIRRAELFVEEYVPFVLRRYSHET